MQGFSLKSKEVGLVSRTHPINILPNPIEINITNDIHEKVKL
jgi:hypothetical protein